MLKGLGSEFYSLFSTRGRRVAGYPQVPLLPPKGILPALTTEEGRPHSTTAELLPLETGVQRASSTEVPTTGMHILHRRDGFPHPSRFCPTSLTAESQWSHGS